MKESEFDNMIKTRISREKLKAFLLGCKNPKPELGSDPMSCLLRYQRFAHNNNQHLFMGILPMLSEAVGILVEWGKEELVLNAVIESYRYLDKNS